jgi:hypothetical protein
MRYGFLFRLGTADLFQRWPSDWVSKGSSMSTDVNVNFFLWQSWETRQFKMWCSVSGGDGVGELY